MTAGKQNCLDVNDSDAMDDSIEEGTMYIPFVCSVRFEGEAKSRRYGVSAGNEFEVEEAVRRSFGIVTVSDIRRATSSEAASLNLSAGCVKLYQ